MSSEKRLLGPCPLPAPRLSDSSVSDTSWAPGTVSYSGRPQCSVLPPAVVPVGELLLFATNSSSTGSCPNPKSVTPPAESSNDCAVRVSGTSSRPNATTALQVVGAPTLTVGLQLRTT